MTELTEEHEECRSREEIRALVTSYFTAQDERDRDTVLDLFSDDARLAMHGVYVADGLPAIRDYFGSGQAVAALGLAPEDIASTFHLMGTHLAEIRGAEASSTTYAVAYLTLRRSEQDELMIRGLRYLDELRRTTAGWRITDRIHTSDWAYVVPATETISFSQRVSR